MKKTVLKKYARLIARKGANVQKGQEVVINCELDQPEFTKMLAEECYKLGSKKVFKPSVYTLQVSPKQKRSGLS